MSEKIVVPALGESITEATVSKWLKIEGDKVNADEPIVELETDKVNLEVPSPITGILTEIISKDGAIVEVGANLGIIKEVKDSSQKEEKINKIKPTIQKNEVTNLETSKEKELSLRLSFSSAVLSSGKSALSMGNNPQNTTGTDGLNPGRISRQGLRSSVIVSPTLASDTVFTPALINQISPGPNSLMIVGFGPKIPTRSIV